MAELQISNAVSKGAKLNEAIARYIQVVADIVQLNADMGVTSSGFSGTSGTQFETGSEWGVVPSATPGAQGLVLQSALGNLASNIASQATTNAPYVNQLDQATPLT